MISAHPESNRRTTVGILAGGQATRLGGVDKAWLERDGVPQVLALVQALAPQCDAVLVSANRNIGRYAHHDLLVVEDRHSDIGPLGGIDALASACRTPWLLTVPVDALHLPIDLLVRLSQSERGAMAIDDDGPQPLIARWRVAQLETGLVEAMADGSLAVHALQSRLGMARVRFADIRFGNLNTLDDLSAAGIAV